MQDKQVVHEIINTSEVTKVRFCTMCDEGNYFPNHWHRAIEIIYLLEGELLIGIEGKAITLKAGQFIVVNANVIHSNKATQHNKYILLQIPVDFMENYLPNFAQITFVVNDDGLTKPQEISQLKHILRKMKQIDDEQEDGFLLRFNGLVFDFLFLLYRHFSVKLFQSQLKAQKKDFDRLTLILKYIQKNYARQISLDEISKVAIFQPMYFCRFFKKYMGVTFIEYQNELRLSFIYRDLIETKDPIYEILERHGFTNYKLFRRMFHEHFGDTPLKIRKRIKKVH